MKNKLLKIIKRILQEEEKLMIIIVLVLRKIKMINFNKEIVISLSMD